MKALRLLCLLLPLFYFLFFSSGCAVGIGPQRVADAPDSRRF
jgi:hypothetical protein